MYVSDNIVHITTMVVIDFLTCGSCQAEFPLSSIVVFMEHKQSRCNLSPNQLATTEYTLANFHCYTCPKKFGAAISLLQHAQYQHKQKIFRDTTNHDTPSAQISSYRDDDAQLMLPKQIEAVPTDKDEKTDDQVADAADATDITEPLSKCCTSVVPKKRKRHFEMKHRTSFFKAARLRRQQHPVPSSSDIYINVDQSSHSDNSYNTQSNSNRDNNQNTVLQPGNTVTIPISGGGLVGNYFGISYTDTSRSSGSNGGQDSQYTHTSQASLSTHSTTPTLTSSGKEQYAASETSSSNGSVVAKKKYPTSKPFKCEYCGDSFNQRIHLKKHLSKHTGVKPYKCGQCDYATVERSHLKVHIRIHTGEKPFKCDHCEYSTAQNSTLKIHLKRHHDSSSSVSLECTHCGQMFPEKTQLLSHKQMHNQSDVPTTKRLPIK